MASLTRWTSVWASSGKDREGLGSLACCSLWGHKELDMVEWLNWTELSSFSKLNNILLYVDIRLCLSLYPWMDTWAVSPLWWLWIVLLWTCCSSVCSGPGFWFSWVEPRKWYVLLNHLATPFGTMWGTAMLTFKWHIFTYAFNCEKNKWTTFQISIHPSCFSNWAIFTRRCEKQTYYLPCCC